MTQISPNVDTRVILGADVGKAKIVVKRLVGKKATRGIISSIDNNAEAIAEALATLGHIDLIVCEVTGGYERALLDAALVAGIPTHRGDGVRIKAFIRSNGVRAKTDKVDARWLAHYGQDRFDSLRLWSKPDQEHEKLQSLVRFRKHLTESLAATKNRLKAPNCQAIKTHLDAELAFFQDEIDKIDKKIAILIKNNKSIAAKEKALREITGFGPVISRVLVAMLPELGSVTRREIASLAGLAPHPDQSGITNRKRPMRGGRDLIRSALFMGALSAARYHPTLKHFYAKLIDNHKPAQKALAAVARKLVTIANAVLRPEKASEIELLQLT